MKFIRSTLTLIKNQAIKNVPRRPSMYARYLSVTPLRFTDKKEDVTFCGGVGKSTTAGGYAEIKARQAMYQVDDGLPIFLKGKNDVYLYKATLVLSIIGVLYSLMFFTSMM